MENEDSTISGEEISGADGSSSDRTIQLRMEYVYHIYMYIYVTMHA